ncbi:1,4-dihydroxy-2-naphthoate polyprenyltransferase [Natronosalvus rutilus]|uniref:1,4-dihydroxy-2-naphthoate octaprenyltransferase n=1 Tax=Natronosalvus rutilus TaxID=2953753 RepID=A0A9E7NAD7_9EURY|nr:1,4-dihydroxy-2-naphthoate polyprenyltransferase [Natronosalvus rutilus]UTF53047.1 1,4-dihydroxy-2-naphthoate polyprenyltransferase [Natronosalvus rutilus]
MSTAEVSRTKAWVMAARPQTLPAAAAPVLVGTGLAVSEGVFAALPALMAFVGAALIQIGTNFANDYYDAVKGADTDDREGFTRVTQSGLIDAGAVKFATLVTFAAAILSGVYLVYVGGLPILVIGLVSVFCGWAYTGGPYPLGYHGLGDLFVFVFFGVVAVVGTFYVQAAAHIEPLITTIPAGTMPPEAFAASLPVAGLSTAILVVNNVRDLETDAETGKRTLAVRLGYRFSRLEFAALVSLAYVVPLWFWLGWGFSASVLLPLLTVPYALAITRTVWTRTDGEALNPALEQTGKLLAGHALLFAIGIALEAGPSVGTGVGL